MDILWSIFEVSVTVFQGYLVCYFICAFMGLDMKLPKSKRLLFCGGAVFALLVMIMNSITIYEGVYGFLYTAKFFLFTLFFLKGSVLKKLFVAILTNGILASVNAFVTSCMSVALRDNVQQIYSEQTLSRFIMIVIVQVLLIYVYGLVLKIASKKDLSLKSGEWALILSVFLISFVSLAFIHMTLINTNLSPEITVMLFVSELGILVINIVCFYMTDALSRSNSETLAIKTQQQQQEYRIQYAETVQKQYEETRRIRHDMKQNIAILYALHKEHKYKEAEDFLHKCENNLSQLDIVIDVGNSVLNAILNYKLSLAKDKGIEIICSSAKNISDINEIDLCAILGNMLDNAIEASEKCPRAYRHIICDLADDEQRLMITVKNSINKSVMQNNKDLITTKNEKDLHGFGIKTIKAIADKYNGNTDFYEEDLTFVCRVILYK